MLPIAALTVFGLLAARVTGAPAGSRRLILGLAVLALLAGQLLPAGHPLRVDLAGAGRSLGWIAAAAVPVVVYAFAIRHLRRRAQGGDAAPRRPVGLVRIAEDTALAAETRAMLRDETEAAADRAPEALSLAWRGPGGGLEGHVQIERIAETAQVAMIWVEAPQRRQGIGARLLAAAEGEAREIGARRMTVFAGSWQSPEFFARAGYRTVAERALGPGLVRIWMEKDLA